MNKQKVDNSVLYAELEAIEKQLLEGIEGIVTDVTKTTNHIFFNKDAFEEREGFSVTAMLSNDEEISELFGIPQPRGLVKANLHAYKVQYGEYPQEGQKIKAKINDDGFYRIVY